MPRNTGRSCVVLRRFLASLSLGFLLYAPPAHAVQDTRIMLPMTDGDGLGDNFEQRIIDFSSTDAINTLDDVLPGDDFDGEGMTNREEFFWHTDPNVPDAPLPAASYPGLVILALLLAFQARRFRMKPRR